MIKLLQNDPTGDSARFGEPLATIIMILRFLWAMTLGIILLFSGVGIALVAVMIIQTIFWILSGFTTNVPFGER